MRLSKTINNCLIGLTLVVALFLIFPLFPIKGNYKILAVYSGSMQPKIKTGSIVVVKPIKNYKIGEIITFRDAKNHISITHRIYGKQIKAGAPVYITKGDTNDMPDKKEVLPEEIIGKVYLSLPYVGYFINFIKKPLVFALIIFSLAAAVIWVGIKKVVKA